MCKEFGILTVDKNQEVPVSAYDFLESQRNQNNKSSKKGGRVDDMVSGRAWNRPLDHQRTDKHAQDDDSDESTSEDEDDGYDNESDTDTI